MERESPMLTLNARPMMGSMSGATIMAPITVATESPMRPKVAMAEASVRRIQNRTSRRCPSRRLEQQHVTYPSDFAGLYRSTVEELAET